MHDSGKSEKRGFALEAHGLIALGGCTALEARLRPNHEDSKAAALQLEKLLRSLREQLIVLEARRAMNRPDHGHYFLGQVLADLQNLGDSPKAHKYMLETLIARIERISVQPINRVVVLKDLFWHAALRLESQVEQESASHGEALSHTIEEALARP
jgi:hypothetical protein